MDAIACKAIIEHFANEKHKECELLLKRWVILREIAYVLQIPFRATIEVQREDLTLSDVYGVWTKMRLHLNACANKRNYKTSLAAYLLDALHSRQNAIFSNPYMTAAIYLDPRFRNQIIRNEEKDEEAKRQLCELWRRISHRLERTQQENRVNTTDEITFEFDADAELDNYLTGRRTRCSNEANNYRNVDIELVLDQFQPPQLPSNASILDYWQTAKDEHPELYELAMIVYAIPPTEVKIERDFSLLNHVFSKRRGQLDLDRLADIMMINRNPEIFYMVKAEELKVLVGNQEENDNI